MLKFSGLLLAAILILSGCSGAGEPQTSDEPDASEKLKELTVKSEDDEVLASTADFEKAEIVYEEGTGIIQLDMYMKDQQMMENMFEERIDQEIFFYYGDELISAPTITMPIQGESFVLLGEFDEDTAEKIVETIEQRAEEDQE